MERGQQFPEDDFDEYGEFDDTFEDLDIPSDEDLDALEREMLQTGALKKEDVKPEGPKHVRINPESFDVDAHIEKLPRPREADASLNSWIAGEPELDDDETEAEKYPNNEQYKWPSEYIRQVMPRDTGLQARLDLHNHLERSGLVDRTNPDMPMVTLRRVGRPRVGVTNASYIPSWGNTVRGEPPTAESVAKSGYGWSKRSRETDNSIGLYEWQVPLEHILGSGMTSEGEVFAVHHPSTKVNRIV